jgi:hypothetical protein
MRNVALVLACFTLSSCTAFRESYPSRTATEQLLISNAAESAASQLKIRIPQDKHCFLDVTNFEGVDARYAISAIKQSLLQQGISIIDERSEADIIIEIRSGALSIDSKTRKIVFPPLPIERWLDIKEMPANYDTMQSKTDLGIAKFSAFAYDRHTGKLVAVADTVIGRSAKGRVILDQVFVTKRD